MTTTTKKEILLGNGAIARGLLEQSCHILTGYPGTPSSEIIAEAFRFKKDLGLDTYIEWSVNEKVAFEIALAASYAGKRAAVTMKQVGLNVASDPLMSSAYTGVIGGFLVVSCDDPGPHSSQTEQDSRFFAMFAKVPVFDPSSPSEARDLVEEAYGISEEFEIPVILRSTTRICHSRQKISLREPLMIERPGNFQKNPARWAATPKFRYLLHKKLNSKLSALEEMFCDSPKLNFPTLSIEGKKTGIISSGITHHIVLDILEETGLDKDIALLKISTPFPLPQKLVRDFMENLDRVLVLEEPSPVMEMQISDKRKLAGRLAGPVPQEGELTPEKVYEILKDFLQGTDLSLSESFEGDPFEEALSTLEVRPQKPSLCPGCPHRASFLAIKRTFPKALYTSDIGCYTLGINMDAVDTCIDMGASISMADGFYRAYSQDQKSPGKKNQRIIATIGDSTFYHSGTGPLLNAVYNRSRFILVILDNEITAMTGMQTTCGKPTASQGETFRKIPLEALVKGCGVEFLKVVNPYEFETFQKSLKEAHKYTEEEGGVAVLISRYPCTLHDKEARAALQQSKIEVTEKCNGCMYCMDHFECRALEVEEGQVHINHKICVDCGACLSACPTHCFVRAENRGESFP